MVTMNAILILLIFGLGHPAHEPLDPAKGMQLHSRVPCDGSGAPEDLLRMHAKFSRENAGQFVVSRYHTERCEVDVKDKCLHHEKPGWRDIWSSSNGATNGYALVPIDSCYEWRSTTPAQYVLSGWYQAGSDTKPDWRQVQIKQVSAQPEVYEFTDPQGGTARVEIDR
jgi:hypothetical protein